MDASGSHARAAFISAGSLLFPNSVLCYLAGNFPFQTGSFLLENCSPASDAGAPTSTGAPASRLVAYTFQKAASGPQRTWQDTHPPNSMPSLWAGMLLRVS